MGCASSSDAVSPLPISDAVGVVPGDNSHHHNKDKDHRISTNHHSSNHQHHSKNHAAHSSHNHNHDNKEHKHHEKTTESNEPVAMNPNVRAHMQQQQQHHQEHQPVHHTHSSNHHKDKPSTISIPHSDADDTHSVKKSNHAARSKIAHKISANHFQSANPEQLFNEYNKSTNSDSLNKKELHSLAEDLVKAFIQSYTEQIQSESPNLSVDDVSKTVAHDLPYLLPGHNTAEIISNVQADLLSVMDLDHHGKVSRTEFLVRWPTAGQKIFDRMKLHNDHTDGQLECTIM